MMAKLIRDIAKIIGIKTVYHISAIAQTDKGQITISLNLAVSPWMHADNFSDVMFRVSQTMPNTQTQACITSITRLGI